MSLVVTTAGMVTCVGLDAASACAAMRARLDGFQETRFIGPGGDWLVGAPVPLPRNWIGLKRMAHLAAGALVDLAAAAPDPLEEATVILCLAEQDRPGRPIEDVRKFLDLAAEASGMAMRGKVKLVEYGRPSGMVALRQAERLIETGEAREVVIIGVDSYLTSRTILHYASQDRLLSPQTHNGFIPGEAAAAVLCRATGKGLRLSGLGLAREEAYIYNGLDRDGLDLPLRAEGMTAAYKAAFEQARVGHHEIKTKIGDLIGESFWFRQSALAQLRTQRERSEVQPIWPIAASLGNIGAAAVPLMIGWAKAAHEKKYTAPGPLLIEASGDDGACGATIAEAA